MTPRPPPTRANTCAVVVTYHPDAEFPSRVRALAAQVDRVVVVDNGSSTDTVATLARLETAGEIDLIRNAANLGIAAALNQGLAWAARRGSAWAITSDQDSAARPELMTIFARVYDAYPQRDRVGALGAAYADPEVNLARRARPVAAGTAFREVRTVITSGCLTAVDVWTAAGPFREEFFIDCVDEEFCLRLRRHGFRVVQTMEVGLDHRLGALSEHRLLGLGLLASHHSALRRYYMTRNAFSLMATSAAREPLWTARKLQRQLQEWLGILAAERGKGRKARAVLLGLWHAVRRRFGPLAPEAAAGLSER